MAPTVYWTPTMQTKPSSSTDAIADVDVPAPAKPVPTPASVRDVTPALCLSLVEFKDMLRQFRAVDDSVTLRLNRVLAQTRENGTSAPPSLLQRHGKSFMSSSATDLGRTTYGNAVPAQMCLAFWKELVDLWVRREDTIRYCIEINQQKMEQAHAPRRSISKDDYLDLDRVPLKEEPRPLPRLSRSEPEAEFTARQMQNELMVERIIRHRSLEAFKSRCRLFQPNDTASEREHAFWEGR